MRNAWNIVSATLLLTALAGCVELNRKSGTRASMVPSPGFVAGRATGAYIGRGDSIRPVGHVDPFGLEMRSKDLIVNVGFGPDRSGPTLIGPIIPLVPIRLRPERVAPGALLYMTVGVISTAGPVTLDPSTVRVILPDGQVLVPVCDPERVSLKSACAVRESPLSGPGRYDRYVTLPLPVDGYRHPSIQIELPVVEVDGRRIALPRITGKRISRWQYGMDY